MYFYRRMVGLCAVATCIATLFCSNLKAGEPLLLDFGTTWCGYCQTMNPVVDQLITEGYSIRKIDGDQEPGLVRQYNVRVYPTFIMTIDGQEVARCNKASKADLAQMFQQARIVNQPKVVRGQSPDTRSVRATEANISSDWKSGEPSQRNTIAATPVSHNRSIPNARSKEQLIQSSVRLKIQENKGTSTGSGTIIDAREGEALILTCGHVFREYKQGGTILVDLFGPNAPQQVPATLVSFDLDSDVGLVRIAADHQFVVAPVASKSFRYQIGSSVTSVGCDHGADASARIGEVLTINRFQGPPNVQVSGQPVQGRSGGGLFGEDGAVIGVCNAADHQEDQGLFAAIGAIHKELDRARLTFVYDSQVPSNLNNRVAATDFATPVSKSGEKFHNVAADSSEESLSTDEQQLLTELRNLPPQSEVICLVRSVDNPQGQSHIMQLNRLSPAFLQKLAETRARNGSRQLTSLENRPTSQANGSGSFALGNVSHPATDSRARNQRPNSPFSQMSDTKPTRLISLNEQERIWPVR